MCCSRSSEQPGSIAGSNLARAGGIMHSLSDEDLPRVQPAVGASANIPEIGWNFAEPGDWSKSNDIGGKLEKRLSRVEDETDDILEGNSTVGSNMRVGFSGVDGNVDSKYSNVRLNRYAPSSVVGVTRPQGAVIGGGQGSKQNNYSNYGHSSYGYGAYGSSNPMDITGRVSVISKASTRSSVVSGISLAGSKPVTKLNNPTNYSSNNIKSLAAGRLSYPQVDPAQHHLPGLATYNSEYRGSVISMVTLKENIVEYSTK